VGVFHELGDRHRQGQALMNLGLDFAAMGRAGDARAVWEQALAWPPNAGRPGRGWLPPSLSFQSRSQRHKPVRAELPIHDGDLRKPWTVSIRGGLPNCKADDIFRG
jgi:hypothetical protein